MTYYNYNLGIYCLEEQRYLEAIKFFKKQQELYPHCEVKSLKKHIQECELHIEEVPTIKRLKKEVRND